MKTKNINFQNLGLQLNTIVIIYFRVFVTEFSVHVMNEN